MNRIRYLAVPLVAGLLAACGGGSSTPRTQIGTVDPGRPPDTSSPYTYQPCDSVAAAGDPALTDAAADGIWQGTLTNELWKATEPYTAIVAADGHFRLMSTGHSQMVGTLGTDGNHYSGEGFAVAGSRGWQDGTRFSELSVAGAIAERDRLTGDFTLASGDAGCFRFDYDAELYERPSSLDLPAGQWFELDGWGFESTSWQLTTQGAISGFDLYACKYSGALALIDARFNLYAVTLDITQAPEFDYPCWGPGSYEGFAYLADTADGASVNHYLHLAVDTGSEVLRFYMHR